MKRLALCFAAGGLMTTSAFAALSKEEVKRLLTRRVKCGRSLISAEPYSTAESVLEHALLLTSFDSPHAEL